MDDDFRFVRSYQYASEAQIFCGKLTSEGIEVFLRDLNTVDSSPIWSNAVGGVKLFVRKEDFEIATKILSDISPFSFDEKNELIKCPSCRAEKIVMVTSVKELKAFLAYVFSFLFVLLPFYSKHRYRCTKCNFEFD
jgi:DNA-directed RNA polymerase subunit RPC12/RpoP